MNWLKIIEWVLTPIITKLISDNEGMIVGDVKKELDEKIDIIEDLVKDIPILGFILIAVLKVIRNAFNIPDNDAMLKPQALLDPIVAYKMHYVKHDELPNGIRGNYEGKFDSRMIYNIDTENIPLEYTGLSFLGNYNNKAYFQKI